MAEFYFRIKYKEKGNELKKIRKRESHVGLYDSHWRKLSPDEPKPNLTGEEDDCIKLWAQEHSCRYVYHNGNWYTDC